MNCKNDKSLNERGGSGVNALVALVVIFLFLYALFQYGSVAYVGADVKKEMRAAVLQAQTAQGRRVSPTQDALKRMELAVKSFNLPPDTYINAQMTGGEVTLEVAYEVEVSLLPFGLYKYKYTFDETATPAGFVTRDDAPKVR